MWRLKKKKKKKIPLRTDDRSSVAPFVYCRSAVRRQLMPFLPQLFQTETVDLLPRHVVGVRLSPPAKRERDNTCQLVEESERKKRKQEKKVLWRRLTSRRGALSRPPRSKRRRDRAALPAAASAATSLSSASPFVGAFRRSL